MSNQKLSLEGLNFLATKIDISNNILSITLNRPEKKNALNNVMMNELNYALAYAKQEREIRVVIIGAEGDVFCAGALLCNSPSRWHVVHFTAAGPKWCLSWRDGALDKLILTKGFRWKSHRASKICLPSNEHIDFLRDFPQKAS